VDAFDCNIGASDNLIFRGEDRSVIAIGNEQVGFPGTGKDGLHLLK
jgi:hypothetical protein